MRRVKTEAIDAKCVSVSAELPFMSTKGKKWDADSLHMKALEGENDVRLVKIYNPWLVGLSFIAGPNDMSGTCMRTHSQRLCEQIECISNCCSGSNDWLYISAVQHMLLSAVDSLWNYHVDFPHSFFDNSNEQADIVLHRRRKGSLSAVTRTHLAVVYLSSAFEVISLLMLPVGPELQELVLIAPRERGEWLRSNRFYVKGITVIWIQNIGSWDVLRSAGHVFSISSFVCCPVFFGICSKK